MIRAPYYLFDQKKFKNLIMDYKNIGEIYYPIKSNDDPLIIEFLIQEGCCFEVDSIEHIKQLITVYHLDPIRILFSYPILEQDDIIQANKFGIKKFVVDTQEEYENICSIISSPSFIVRLNAVEVLGPNYSPPHNKWGMTIDNAKALIDQIRAKNQDVIGISFYLFKEIVSPQSLKNMLAAIRGEFYGYDLRFLNIGGGISPCDINKVNKDLCKTKEAIGASDVIIEPGTPLLNPCIDMIVSVTAIRYINGCRFIFINSGIYRGLIDTIIKQRHFDIQDEGVMQNSDFVKTIVCGASSDVSDCLGEYNLRSNLRVGDQLIIKECGAYSKVMQTCFCQKEHIPMILASV